MENDKEKVHQEYQHVKKEVAELRAQLKQLKDQKEESYHAKETISQEIATLINTIKELRKQRNALTDAVAGTKKNRQELHQALKEKISTVQHIKGEQPKVFRKENPGYLKRQMEQLEMKIQ